MTRGQRRVHLVVWLVLTPLVLLLVGLAVAHDADAPDPSPIEASR